MILFIYYNYTVLSCKSLVKSQKEISPFDPPPLYGTVVVLHTLNIMIMTCSPYARILEDLFHFDTRFSHTSEACGRPLTTKTSNVTYLTFTLHQRNVYVSLFLTK